MLPVCVGVAVSDAVWLLDPEPVAEIEAVADELGVAVCVEDDEPEGVWDADGVPDGDGLELPVPLPLGAALCVPLAVGVAPAEAEPLSLGVPELLGDSDGVPVWETDMDGPHTVFSALSQMPG
jgi:hypothetical protein